ncbi:MAG: S46 family peptidase [Chlamydiales bacterium]|nr:S46 family peptidase [Chlamydiales bacterium]
MKKALITTLITIFSFTAFADEGMWTFDKVPVEAIYQKYKVNLSEDWIKHVRLSSLRVSLGGSASFVSSNGLVITNHHVGSGAIYNLSSEKTNLIEDGFYAASYDEELPCSNMYVDQLIEIRDVTEQVKQSFTPAMSFADQEESRKKTLALLKDSVQKQTGLQVEDVTLFQGAKYHLYLYKRYTDVRLVMAPEKAIAYFGGDIENFEYPRYDLDVCLFRVYEDGKPLVTKDYLKWSTEGPSKDDILFVIGNPGSTKRIFTSGHLQFLRDVSLPLILNFLQNRIDTLQQYSLKSDENARQASDDLFSLRNSQKALTAENKGLQEKSIIQDKEQSERTFFQTLSQTQQTPWNDLNNALRSYKEYVTQYFYLEQVGFRFSKDYLYARDLVRYAAEKQKPNEKRLKEYQDTQLSLIQLGLLSTEPVYPGLEKAMLADFLKDLVNVLGPTHPLVKTILGNKTPDEKADEIIENTKMGSLEYRKTLFENPSLIETSQDPMIVLVKTLDPYARDVRARYENEFDSIRKSSYASIMTLYFDQYGDTLYPDATFTPRISYGVMKGYREGNHYIEPMTDYQGLYKTNQEHDNKTPYQMPMRWLKLAPLVNGNTPLNFVSTNDIIGGNSGSPIINQKGELVGVIFDGNKNSSLWDLEFTDVTGRAISVHSVGILYALEHIYQADRLVSQLHSE